MADPTLHLGEPADEADWRALVEQGLKGAQWSRLVGATADGIPIQPLYREPDFATATDVSGMPGGSPFVRGARQGAWTIRQTFEHPDLARTNDEILTDLAGGVAAIELVLDPAGKRGVAINNARDLDVALSQVMIDVAPMSLDAAPTAPADYQSGIVEFLREKLGGAANRGIGFNLDPIGRIMRGGMGVRDGKQFSGEVARLAEATPKAQVIRIDARPVHEGGGTEAQEIAAALTCGIEYLRWMDETLAMSESASVMGFAVSVGPDVLIETAKLRALRLCWARVLEASGVDASDRGAHIHAFTSRRMMTRYDAWANILRVTTAAFAAGVGGADDITTYPLTDALGLPTPFARRVARNTQHVLLEECRLGHVADPAGGSWFVEKLTHDLANKAWALMQQIEAQGGIVAVLDTGWLSGQVATARATREKAIATRRETITGVTDFPLLGAELPEFVARAADTSSGNLAPMRWAAPFEALRDRAERAHARVFFANLATLAEFGTRAQWARNLFGAGGVHAIGPEDSYASMDALVDAFRASGARVAIIAGADARYAEHGENAAQRLKAAGAHWVMLAGKPGDLEPNLRTAGVDQFVFAGQDAVGELNTLHAALGLPP